MSTERRRVLACLQVWTDAGLTIARHGHSISLDGMEPPGWWPDWCERHAATLAKILPNQDAPDRPRPRPSLPEDLRPAWNEISAPASRERPRRVLPGTVRLEALQRLAEYAAPD